MALFENLGKRFGEAAQAAVKKSSELVEVTKLSVSIGSETDKIQKLYAQIGKMIYDRYEETGMVEDYAKAACEEIKAHEKTIRELRKRMAEVKGMKQCANCGAEMEKEQLFCSRCGAKSEQAPAGQDEKQEASQEDPQEALQAQETPKCSSCGTAAEIGAGFCTNCGAKLE